MGHYRQGAFFEMKIESCISAYAVKDVFYFSAQACHNLDGLPAEKSSVVPTSQAANALHDTPWKCSTVWNRRKQEWMEVDATQEQSSPGGASSPSSNQISSNAFASGVSQNSGNFLTEKPITKIHAPPGGASSIVFGDEISSTPSKAAPQASKAPIAVAIPTQPTTPESSTEGASTTAPAEDESSTPTEPTGNGPEPIPMKDLASASVPKDEEPKENGAAASTALETKSPEPKPAPVPGAPVSANAYASGVNQNSGNFMTGRPTTRVRAPPGGASSITFG